MGFSTFIRRNYNRACKMQRKIHQDMKMIEMLKEDGKDEELVKSWMRGYGLFRGIHDDDRNRIVRAFLKFTQSRSLPKNIASEKEIEELFMQLFSSLYHESKRGWLSATTKLLWCLYPDEVVIFDSFVWRALVVMQCLDKQLTRYPRIEKAPQVNNTSSIEKSASFYMNYYRLVFNIMQRHSSLLDELRRKYKESYKYDIRIIDKLLWMIGNPKEYCLSRK